MKYCFVVMVMGYWGVGATVGEAAKNCFQAGGKRGDKAILRLIVGDDKPQVDSYGSIHREPDSENIDCGNCYTLGQLMKQLDIRDFTRSAVESLETAEKERKAHPVLNMSTT